MRFYLLTFDFDQTSQQREEEEEIVIRDRLLRTAPSWTALESLSTASVTRSHRGHMVKAEVDDGFSARSSSTSICSRRFCSFNDPNHLFRYAHSISVCFSLLLYRHQILCNHDWWLMWPCIILNILTPYVSYRFKKKKIILTYMIYHIVLDFYGSTSCTNLIQ